MVTESGDLVVLAVQRNGEDGRGDTELAVGDTLLLQRHLGSARVPPRRPGRARRRRPRARAPAGGAARAGREAGDRRSSPAMVCCSPRARCRRRSPGCSRPARSSLTRGAHRRRRPTAGSRGRPSMLVAGMIPLSTAMAHDGRRRARSPTRLVDVVGDPGPHALLLGLVRAHARARPADQQHGDGADRDADRACRPRPSWTSRRSRS